MTKSVLLLVSATLLLTVEVCRGWYKSTLQCPGPLDLQAIPQSYGYKAYVVVAVRETGEAVKDRGTNRYLLGNHGLLRAE